MPGRNISKSVKSTALPSGFSVRVYGFLVNENEEILVSHETLDNFSFTKFPGGGLEFGEGPRACVAREYKEETGLEVETGDHIYTSDFYIQSKINPNKQVIGIYYEVEPKNYEALAAIKLSPAMHDFGHRKTLLRFEWIPLKDFDISLLTFEMDRRAMGVFLTMINEQ